MRFILNFMNYTEEKNGTFENEYVLIKEQYPIYQSFPGGFKTLSKIGLLTPTFI